MGRALRVTKVLSEMAKLGIVPNRLDASSIRAGGTQNLGK